MANTVSEFASGAALLGRGLALVAKRPRMAVLGAIPALITSVLFTSLLVILFAELDSLVRWLTPFANGWASGSALLARVVVGLSLLAGAVLLMVITFSALTLTLGAPLYDRISEFVDAELSSSDGTRSAAAREEPLARSLARGLQQSVALIAVSLAVGAVLVVAGLLPVVGQIVVPVVSTVFGGWMLCIELVGSTFERRGRLRISERRQAMRSSRARVLGFAVPTFLLLAVPFVAVVVFPVATAGATILGRDLLARTDQRAAERALFER